MSGAELDALMVVDLVSLLLDPMSEFAGDSDTLMDSVAPVNVAGVVEAAVAYLRRFGRLPDAPPQAGENGGSPASPTSGAMRWRSTSPSNATTRSQTGETRSSDVSSSPGARCSTSAKR